MTPPLRLDFYQQNTVENGVFSGKYEHLRIVKVVGGVMTPPYEAVPNNTLN